MAATPKLRLLRSRPLCIMCGRPREAEAIAKTLGIYNNRIAGDEVMKVNNGYTFFTGSFTLESGEQLYYYVTSSLRQGIQSFTVCSSVLFSILRPRFVIHAGVCAGYDDPTGKLQMKIADVVFGEAATNYEEGKLDYTNGEFVHRPDFNRVLYDAGDMQAFAEAESRPRYHYGEYLSGSSVRTDASLVFDRIRKNVNRNAIALDMEASAYLQLCAHFENDQVISLGVIKGISDFGDPTKGSVPNAYNDALLNTAQAIKEWILHRIRGITWTIDETDEPGAKIVPGYYDNFIRRVLDNVLQGWPVRNKGDPSQIILGSQIKGLKTVLPRNNDPGFAQELGPVQSLVQTYNVGEVDIGGNTAGRYLHYKGGYLIDWGRCVNSLKICEDGEYQVGVFARLLSRSYYYKGSSDTPALAEVVSWEDTVAWLQSLNEVQQNNVTEETATECREIRPTRGEESGSNNGHSILGEARRESPASRVEDPTTGGSPSPSRNGAGTRTVPTPELVPQEGKRGKSRGATRSPEGTTGNEANAKRKTFSISPKRSMSRFLDRFRGSVDD